MRNSEPSRQDTDSSEALPYAMLIAAAMILASNHIIARYFNEMIPPLGLVFWRMVVGSLVILPFAISGAVNNRQTILENFKLFLIMACLFVPLGNGLIYVGYNFTTALNGGVVSTTQPALTVLISCLLFRDFINWKQATGIIIAALGVFVIISRGSPQYIMEFQPNPGDILILVATVFIALHNVLLRSIPKQISIITFMFVIQIVGAWITLPFYMIETYFYKPVPTDFMSIGVLLWVGIAITSIAVGLMNSAVRIIGANKASIGNYMRSLFTAFLAIVFLGEEVQVFHVLSLVFVLGGVYLMTKSSSEI